MTALLAVALPLSARDDEEVNLVCNNLYALCTSAPCIPDPRHPETAAICTCEVDEGLNFGFASCEDRKPSIGKDGVTTLLSTYSFGQVTEKAVMRCDVGTPWTDCLDVKCTVDPRDPLKAICTCKRGDVESPRDDYVTYGGGCNTLTCEKSYWSAATIGAFELGTKVLATAMGLKENPITFCPRSDLHQLELIEVESIE